MVEETQKQHPGVRVPPPLAALAAVGLGCGLDLLWPAPLSLLGPALPWGLRLALGAGLLLAGFGLAFACFLRFRTADTAIEPWKPASALVADGPYRLSRNPIYLGLMLCLAGVGVMANSLWILAMLLPLWAFLRFAVIALEERYLEARFGEGYRRYCGRVRRWL